MNNVQSGITSETIGKELKAREKWKASYAKQFGLPLSDPGDAHGDLPLPGPIVRVKKPLPFNAYVPSSYAAVDAGNGSGSGAASASGGAAPAEVRHNAPYAYAEGTVSVNPNASFGASITRSGLRAAVAHGPIDPNGALFVKGDNTVALKPSAAAAAAAAAAHGDSKHTVTAGIKTRPQQLLLAHTKAANTVAGTLAPDTKHKIGAASAAQHGAAAAAATARPVTPAAANGGAEPQPHHYLHSAGDALRPPSASGNRPPSAGAAAAAAAAHDPTASLSATQLSAYNLALRPSSSSVAPDPNLALAKSATLYSALHFRVKNCDQRGVLATKVDAASAAEAAGLRTGDLIAYVNNRPTRSVDEYYAVVAHVSARAARAACCSHCSLTLSSCCYSLLLQAQATLHLTIRRRGVPKLAITLKI